jgi:hypothetical protein
MTRRSSSCGTAVSSTSVMQVTVVSCTSEKMASYLTGMRDGEG